MKEWLGPGFEGRAVIINRSRVRVNLERMSIDTLVPLRGLPLDELQLWNTRLVDSGDTSKRISDLEPLRGMRLSYLNLDGSKVADISPLQGMPLEELNISWTNVTDLSPLRGAPLRRFFGPGLNVEDWSPLSGSPLQVVGLGSCNLRRIDFLAGSSVESFTADGNYISDLSPLRGKPLKTVNLASTPPLRDLSPLRGTPIIEIRLDGTPLEDFTPMMDMTKLERIRMSSPLTCLLPLRKHPSLKYIAQFQNGPMRPVAEVWKELETQAVAAGTTLDDHERNVRLLKERLPPLASSGGTNRISIRADAFGEITVDLRDLPIQDLEVLRGLQIHRLILTNTAVASLEPLRGMGLKTLDLTGTRVRDLSPLENAPVTDLIAIGAPLESVEPILRLPKLERLRIAGDATKLAPLRRHPSLRMLSGEIAPAPYRPAADFWRELDKGAAQQK